MAAKRYRGNKWTYQVRAAGLLPKPIYLSFDDEAAVGHFDHLGAPRKRGFFMPGV